MEYLYPHLSPSQREALSRIKSYREKRYQKQRTRLLQDLPEIKDRTIDLTGSAPRVISPTISKEEERLIYDISKKLMPWRKGPFQIFQTFIDSEWKSQLKWNRLNLKRREIQGKVILDIGCNNGYFLFKMAMENPSLLLGIDPIDINKIQFEFLQSFFNISNIYFELFGYQELIHFDKIFDLIFFMGIIYHHKDPINQLIMIRKALKPGGTLYLETIGIVGDGSYALFPEKNYGKIKNIWFIPTLSCLINWAKKSKFVDIEVLSQSKTTEDEQRLTKWCGSVKNDFKNFLDPQDSEKTLDGHEAPYRFCLKMKRDQ